MFLKKEELMTKLINTLRGASKGTNSVARNRQILASQSPHPDSFPVCGVSLRLKSDGGSSRMSWQALEIMQEVSGTHQ